METHHIFICVNELIEHSIHASNSGFKLPKEFLKAEGTQNYIRFKEDLFWGESANWDNISNRIEEYQHLSFLKPICLQIHYWNYYESFCKVLNAENSNLYFYDECICKSDFLALFRDFSSDFKLEFLHEVADLPYKKQAFFMEELDYRSYLKTA